MKVPSADHQVGNRDEAHMARPEQFNEVHWSPMAEECAPTVATVVPHLIQLVEPRSVVDVGCGTGALACRLCRQWRHRPPWHRHCWMRCAMNCGANRT